MGPTGEESRHRATGGEPRRHRPESAQSHPHSGLPGPAQGKLECSHANTVSFTVLSWETFSRSLHGSQYLLLHSVIEGRVYQRANVAEEALFSHQRRCDCGQLL